MSSNLIRYGVRWKGAKEPICTPMDDGYWTPWHLAQAEIDALKAELANEQYKSEGLCKAMQSYRDELERFKAAQQWRDIESAPKDGRPIAVLDDQDRMIVAYWHPYPRNGGDFRTSDGLCSRLAPEMLLGWTALSVPDYDGLAAIAKARGESV